MNLSNIHSAAYTRRVATDIQKNGIFVVGMDRTGFTIKMGDGISGKKITAYPNEAIHNDCVVAFTGGYYLKHT